MQNSFSYEGHSLRVRLHNVSTRPGALKLVANDSMTPEALLAVAAWLNAKASQAIADREGSE